MEQRTVAELKQMCRDRGLKLEHKGHKFNKEELIANIKQYDSQKETEKEKEEVEIKQEIKDAVKASEIKKNAPHKAEAKVQDITKKEVVDLTRKIIAEYTQHEKHYNNVESKSYNIGDLVAYIRYVTTKTGKLIKKVGTAKIVDIVTDGEGWLVSFVCETPVNEKVEIDVDDVLYIRNASEHSYPYDIRELLYKQRMEYKAYKEKLKERYGDNKVN